MAARVLCIGVDPLLLNTRCAVLRSGGYEALSVMPYDAEELLETGQFDLIILSMFLTESDKAHFTQIKGDRSQVLRLENFVPADELLREVEQQLAAIQRKPPKSSAPEVPGQSISGSSA